MKKASGTYVVSFEAEPFHKSTRYHWLICRTESPEKLVSWGYAATLELAQEGAEKQLNDLSAGLTQGGRATCKAATDSSSGKRK
jgi:hypothetical protein